MNTHTIRAPRAQPRALLVHSVAAFVILSATLAGCGRKAEEPKEPAGGSGNVTLTDAQRKHIQLHTVQPSTFRRSVDVTGVVDFDNDQATSVLAPFSGPVSRLLVSPGDEVKKGAPLAAVDSPDFAAAVSAYQKALATAQTNRRLADADRDLLEHHGVSEREATQAATDAVNAEADRDAALQALVALGVPAQTLRDLAAGRPVTHLEGMIRSPVAGTVVERLVTPGQLLEAGATPAFTVADLSRVWVMAQVFGADLASVRVGDSAAVLTDSGTTALPGRVDNISALVDPNTRAVAVRVVAENPQRLLKRQMYVRVRIESRRESSGLLVPVSSVLRDDENLPFVYLVQKDGGYARQHVTLGERTGEQYLIADGLKAGDQAVVDGAIFIQFIQSQ